MPETIARVIVPVPHAAQTKALESDARFRVLCWGRRSGKTELCELDTVKTVLNTGLPVGWFAPIARASIMATAAGRAPGA